MSESIRLVVAVPSSGRNDFGFTYSLATLIGALSQGVRSRPDCEFTLSLDGQVSSCIHSNRELLVRRAIDRDATHLLFLDDDMSFHPEAVNLLFSRRHPVVACNYLIKHEDKDDPQFVAVAPCGRRIVTREASTGLQEIAYSGFGVSLFEVRVFKGTPQPWFLPEFVAEASSYTTEDNPCYRRIREAGFPCYIDHDASKMVEHCGRKRWKWDQWRPPAGKKEG